MAPPPLPPPKLSLGKPSLKARLERYYQLTAPDLIANSQKWRERFEQIWNKYGGSESGEHKLAAKLAQKYGDFVRLETVAALSPPQSAPPKRTVAKLDETWFVLNDKERDSGCIDFLSDRFDPVAALQKPDEVNLPKNIPILDRVDLFKRYLPEDDPLFEEKRTAKRKRALPDEASKNKTTGNCFAQMHHNNNDSTTDNQSGPMSILYRACFSKPKQRIRVVTRYVDGIRGIFTGYMIGYDKHFNLILKDVDETYSPRPTKDDREISNAQQEIQRRLSGYKLHSGKLWTNRQRHVRQLLVRGDTVVSVYFANQERSVFPPPTLSPPLQRLPNASTRMSVAFGTPGSLVLGGMRPRR